MKLNLQLGRSILLEVMLFGKRQKKDFETHLINLVKIGD